MSRYINLDEATDLLRGIDATMAGEFVADLLESLPTIEVSEDAISRATALEIYSDLYWMDERLLNFKSELDKVYDELRNAPSVIPQQEEGEWIHDGSNWEYRFNCTNCGYHLIGKQTKFCPECGSKMKGAGE